MGENIMAAIGLGMGACGCLFIVLGFATPYWMVSTEGKIASTQLERLGLWEFCFKQYSDYRDSFGKIYNGCWWLFSREYDSIRKYLLTSWFATAQALMTLSVIFSLLSLLFGIFLLLKCFPQKTQLYVAYLVTLLYFLIGLMVGIGVVYFGVHADTDQSWLKQPRLRQLSWSFWVSAIGGIFAVIAACFYTIYCVKVRAGGHRSTAYRAHELRHYRNNHYFK